MSKRSAKVHNKLEDLDEIIERITEDAYGDNEKLWAFRQVLEDEVTLPADGFVIGEPVSVLEVDYDGNERRGLTAKCRREDGSEYVIDLLDVMLPQTSTGAAYIAAYRKWLNMEPYPAETQKRSQQRRQHKATEMDIDLNKPVELAVLSVGTKSARCRLLGSGQGITLRTGHLWKIVPGCVVTVSARKQWRYGGHPYLSGEILSTRIDAKALDLIPLKLENMGMWDPAEDYWREQTEPIEEWEQSIIDRGPCPMFEMEQVLPEAEGDDCFDDPIIRSNELKAAGDVEAAMKILTDLCKADLRCLDAHSHLGNFLFDHRPEDAGRHYEVGFRIGELSLGNSYSGVLLWGLIDNRPFLRCMHGYGLCLWRLNRFDEAVRIFRQILRLNPPDNQGVRFLIDAVEAGEAWEDLEDR